MCSPTAHLAGGATVSRLDRLLRRLVALLPWYDPGEVESRHRRTERVRRHSIAVRQRAEDIPAISAVRELRRLETAARRRP